MALLRLRKDLATKLAAYEGAVAETLPATPAPTAADATDASSESAFAAAARAFAGQSSSLTASGEILLLGLDDATLKDMRLAFDSFEPGENDQIRSGQVGMTLVGSTYSLSPAVIVSLSLTGVRALCPAQARPRQLQGHDAHDRRGL